MFKYIKLLLILFIFTACSSEHQPKPNTPLIIKTTNGDIRFMVETALTPDELKTGLMNRTNLGFNSGMIFNIYPVRPVAMWMKNTKIPLDMLFIAPDSSISMIKENATPMSEEHIISEAPVRAVIEINAGQVKRHGIKIGDKVTHPLLTAMTDIKIANPKEKNDSLPNNSNANINIPKLKVEPKVTETPNQAQNNTSQPSQVATPSTAPTKVQVPTPVPAPSL